MAAPPLTHHEIVRLVEPFVRQGRHVDLGATDRVARRIAFRPRERATDMGVLRETLELEARGAGDFVLRRTLAPADGPAARLQASGAEPAALLERIDAVAPARHFSAGGGYRVVRSYDALPHGGEASALALTEAQLCVDGLTLTLVIALPRQRSVAADLSLAPAGDQALELPEDLLAVLGWDWARLVATDTGWKSKLRLRGAVLRRSRTAEAALERAGAHLVQVLAEPPAAFHDRHRWARWGVVLRRGIPSLTALGMVGGALALPYLTDPSNSGLWMALHYVPIAVLALSFKLQELPRFEIPPWPRRSRAPAWRVAPAAVPVR